MPNDATLQRWFNPSHAFDNELTVIIITIIVTLLILATIATFILTKTHRIPESLTRELQNRIRSWIILIAVVAVPILLGALWTLAAILIAAILCYREFARATGLFRHKLISLTVVITVLTASFAVLDHWYNFFTALPPLAIALIALVALLSDQPRGYLQRVSLAILAFLLFGVCFGYLAYITNDANYRPHLLLLIFTIEINDIFAYLTGKRFGNRKLIPNTSPNKTIAGAVGALVLTTITFALLGRILFANTTLAQPLHLLTLGFLLSFVGQSGDLVISSIKRDLGIKDMGTLLPGHGGLLDRFDSLLLAAPVYFHYVGYVVGFGWDTQVNIFLGSGSAS